MNKNFLSIVFVLFLTSYCSAESETTSVLDAYAQDSQSESAREVLSKLKKKLKNKILRKTLCWNRNTCRR